MRFAKRIIIEIRSDSYTYDKAFRITSHAENDQSVTATSSYNAKDQRMTTITYEDGQIISNETVCYHYLGGNVSCTTDAQNDILMKYLTAMNSVIAGEDVTNHHTYLYTKDIENSTRSLIDENGNCIHIVTMIR